MKNPPAKTLGFWIGLTLLAIAGPLGADHAAEGLGSIAVVLLLALVGAALLR